MNLYINVMLTMQGYSPLAISLMNIMGSLGLFITGFYTDRFIYSLGLATTFIVCALISTILGNLFFIEGASYTTILCLRLLLGIIVGLMYVVVESWVLATPPLTHRGEHLAFYMIVLYASQAISPFLLDLPFNVPNTLFLVSSWFCLTSILPIIFFHQRVVSVVKDLKYELSIREVYQRAPIAFQGCIFSGIIMASYTGLLPYYAVKQNYSVSILMSALTAGGALFQWPLGKGADLFGRQLMLMAISFSIVPLTALLLLTQNPTIFTTAVFFIGAFSFAIYPISIALSCDFMKSEEVVAATKALLLGWSVGAIAGPPLIAFCVEFFHINELLFFLTAIVSFLFGCQLTKNFMTHSSS
jgi:MFS family permease